jgi:hypothetical protein
VSISINSNNTPINSLACNAAFLASPNLTLTRPCLSRREERGEEREEEEEEEDVGVLDWQTYQGGTRGSRLCGEDRDRETENSKVCARTQDTRFIQVRVARVATLRPVWGIKYGALRLVLVEIRCLARYRPSFI